MAQITRFPPEAIADVASTVSRAVEGQMASQREVFPQRKHIAGLVLLHFQTPNATVYYHVEKHKGDLGLNV